MNIRNNVDICTQMYHLFPSTSANMETVPVLRTLRTTYLNSGTIKEYLKKTYLRSVFCKIKKYNKNIKE